LAYDCSNKCIFTVPNKWCNVIDHLFSFATQATAQTDSVVGAYWNGTNWDTSCCIPGVVVVSANATAVPIGWFITISLQQLNAAMQASSACLLITDRNAGILGNTYVLYSPILTAAQKGAMKVYPQFAGHNYPILLGSNIPLTPQGLD
jgi:hypothetical protein